MSTVATTAEDVLDFWFGREPDDGEVARLHQPLWFGKHPSTDATIQARFSALREQALAGALDGWTADPRGRLALIVLVDQFSRNLFRTDARAFAHDAQAQRWVLEGLAHRADLRLRAIERVFYYLPLEHAEDLALQDLSVQLFGQLAAEVPPAQRAQFQGYLDYAERHRAIIARFGRFPHRNAVLHRPSTPEETRFLQEPGSSF